MPTTLGRPQSTIERASFNGSASEYFGIWIVNILLTIVTLGIYSAWAKVRRRRYFYGNTELDGFTFDYHATGKQILIGRLIVFALFVLYNIFLTVLPLVGLLIFVAMIVLLPFMIARSLRFNARVTSYRNVRFDFNGRAGGAFKAFLLGSIVAGVSLGLLAPIASRWTYRYVINNLAYGDRPFATDVKLGNLYRGALVPFLMVIGGLLILIPIGALLVFPMLAQIQDGTFAMSDEQQVMLLVGGFYLAMIPLILLYVIAGLVYRITMRNIALSATTVDARHRLVSTVPRFGYAFVVITNLIVTILTLGLMRPWAAVREWRYVAVNFGLIPDGDLSVAVAGVQQSGSAFSAEFLDVDGFDFGF